MLCPCLANPRICLLNAESTVKTTIAQYGNGTKPNVVSDDIMLKDFKIQDLRWESPEKNSLHMVYKYIDLDLAANNSKNYVLVCFCSLLGIRAYVNQICSSKLESKLLQRQNVSNINFFKT